MLKYVNAYNPSGSYKINDYRFLAERLDSMEASYAQGDIDSASFYRTEMAQEIVGMYEDNGTEISLEEAYALVDYQYTFMSDGVTVLGSETLAKVHNSNEEILNNDELSFGEKIGQSMQSAVDITTDSLLTNTDTVIQDNENQTNTELNYPTYRNQSSSLNAPIYQNTANSENSSGSPEYNNVVENDFIIDDYTFMADDLEEMHEEYLEGDEDDAEEIEDELIEEIMEIYSDNGAEISRKDAKTLINQQYAIINGATIDNAELICEQIVEQEEIEAYREEHPIQAFFGLC